MNGFYAQIVQATIALVTSMGPVFLAAGIAEFRAIVVILFIWEGFKIAFLLEPATKLATLLVYVAIVYSALVYYSAPFPGVGRNLTQVITDGGANMAQTIDTTMEEKVGAAVATTMGNVTGSSWDVVLNPMAAIRYYAILFATSAIQIAMLGVISIGFVVIGILALIGPILIPFALVPGLDWLATGWFRCLIQYSLYPVVGNAFVLIYGTVWLNYFSQFNSQMDSQTIASLFIQIIILSLAGVYGIFKIPRIVSEMCSGSSGSGISSFGWWK